MTPDDPIPDDQPRDDRLSAAELALGLLEGPERTAALERLLADADFAAEVAWWRAHLDELLADYGGADAPASVPALAANDVAPAAAAPSRRWPWLTAGALGGAAAAALATAALLPTPEPRVVTRERIVVQRAPQPTVQLVAVLVPAEGERRQPVAAVVDRSAHRIRLSGTIEVPRDRVAELWRIGDDSVPRAVGVLPGGARTLEDASAGELPRAEETIAISLEPRGGSPTGKPTGPVVASGQVIET